LADRKTLDSVVWLFRLAVAWVGHGDALAEQDAKMPIDFALARVQATGSAERQT